ncbi:hypothetical protein VHUM_00322 [Vanrija humicola]|uniref:Uncharacterized protein n=1 Tax=Vanrija humicola TaxID=5417 RepID=A0A7D8Z407_VANHU|nr:hypothetical protein VHUM_00322 [Vanrija humicola]
MARSPAKPNGNDDTPSKRTRRDGASSPAKAETTPTKRTPKAAAAAAVTTPTSARKSAKRVAESLAAESSKRAKVSPTNGKHDHAALPSFDDDVFGSSPAISREAFLANERLRRQREARNFTFEGDASAPKLTRSGRVIGKAVDEYGGEEGEEGDEEGGEADEKNTSADPDDDDDSLRARRDEVPLESARASMEPLKPEARPHVLRILSTLTSRAAEPFVDEETNEAIQGLVGLLSGTVERGEGNSALVTGARGVGKTKTVERALALLPASSSPPIIVRLSGLAQSDDRKAIREMGRQIAEATGQAAAPDDDDEEDVAGEYAPTTLPSHLLALLTAPSPRAIIVVIDDFDLFTEHARQALLYCLLDVVQSVQTGPVETTGRGIAVVGVTCRVDTLLLLEKRVKSRFSHRVWRVQSPLAPDGLGWRALLRHALVPWDKSADDEPDKETRKWMGDWAFAVDMLLDNDRVSTALERLAGLTTDVRVLYRPFIGPITSVLSNQLDFLSVPVLCFSVLHQTELAGWGLSHAKLKGLPHPALGVLIIAKHLALAGRPEFSLAQVEDEYLKFARTRLVGSGRARWPLELLHRGFDHCRALGLLAAAGPGSAGRRFAKVRSVLSPNEVVQYFRADGGAGMGPELQSWGRLMDGHA